MLTATNISYRFAGEKHAVLQDISLSLAPKDRIGIIAPSGVGKTTLCRILAGYLPPDNGQVLVDGQPIRSCRGYCPVQMVWQHPEMVVNPRLRMRATLEEAPNLSPHIVDALQIDPAWLDRYPQALSGGELQRFCIARALGEGTRYLLADEITTMLDLITQAQIWRFLLAEMESRGIGLLAVSHDETLLPRICDRCIQLPLTSEPN